MTNSHWLAIIVLASSLLCAWAVVHFGRKAGQPEKKLRRLRIGFVAGGIAFAAFAYGVDSGLRRTTLFEVVLEGSDASTQSVVRVMRFEIEHPGVEHELLVEPKPAWSEQAPMPISLGIRLAGPNAAVWVDRRATFRIITESPKGSMALASRDVWESHSFRFTPQHAGVAELSITVENPGLHAIHVRVEDPLKTDGKRADGY